MSKDNEQGRKNWLARQAEKIQASGIQHTEQYANKAVDAFAKRNLHDQCKIYLSSIGIAKVMGNAKSSFIEGLKTDYARENKGGTVSVEEWLKTGYAEPLFEEILSKLKITHAELETALKEKA